jgi:electron transfer flavoprotein beta subunit
VVAGLAPATYPPRKKVVIQEEPAEVVKKLVEILKQDGVL